MRAITACAAVALSIAPQHANAYPALATYGFGVINTDQDVKADIKDIYNIAARVLCLETEFDIKNNKQLPTGDILNPPTALLVVAVQGADYKAINEETPYLQSVFTKNSKTQLEGEHLGIKSFTAAFRKNFQAKSNPVPVSSSSNTVQPSMVLNLESKTHTEKPVDVIVRTYSDGVKQLDATLESLIASYNKSYDGRLAYQIVLLGEPVNNGRLLQEEAGTATPKSGLATNEDVAYVLISWTSFVLFFIIFLLFWCIPWSSPLDPLLYSGLAREDVKRD
mmetsp:Transcript_18894/g.30880  ORF Transcript_18894/g.30880 Transcript_18894/m.30880 type:complete len:279 (+) Transcript_18894:197-1033(+)